MVRQCERSASHDNASIVNGDISRHVSPIIDARSRFDLISFFYEAEFKNAVSNFGMDERRVRKNRRNRIGQS